MQVGTFYWAAPEVLLGKMCTEKVDVYSYGVILWELAAGEAPSGRSLRPLKCALSLSHAKYACSCMHYLQLLRCGKKNGPYSGWQPFGLASRVGEEVPEDVNQMIARCMAEDPADRPSAMELVAFFSDLATSTSGDSAAGLSPQKVRAGVVIHRKILGCPYSYSKKELGPSQHARNGGHCNL